MANDVDTTVRDCCDCVWKKPSERRKSRLKVFPASDLLGFVLMDILAPLPETSNGNQFFLVVKDRQSKVTRAVPTCKTAAVHVASMLMDHWIILYGIPDSVLTENVAQFISKFFRSHYPFME